jgi:hypothetical protein
MYIYSENISIYIHINRWILEPLASSKLPQTPLNKCDEHYCLLSTRKIEFPSQGMFV